MVDRLGVDIGGPIMASPNDQSIVTVEHAPGLKLVRHRK